jgi:hypothetical protein
MRICQLVLGLLIAVPASVPADDFKVIKLEQDVRNLERQVSDLYRQVNALQRRGTESETTPSAADHAIQSVPVPDNVPWFDVRNWDRVRVGMNELDVIHLLGKPTSMRGGEAADARTLLYATEIGSSGFLSGSVELKNRQVVAVNKPVLK